MGLRTVLAVVLGIVAVAIGSGPAIAVTVLPASSAPIVITAPGVYEGGPVDVACRADHDIEVLADGVTIRHMTLLNANEAAVRIGTQRNVVLENVTIRGFNCANQEGQHRAGVACWGCTALAVRNSHIETSRTYGNGIWIKNYGTGTGGGHTVTGNTIIGGFDGLGGEPEDVAHGGVYKDTLIAGNHIVDCEDDGIQVEGGNVNVRVQDNVIDGCGFGVAFAPNITGPLYIERNQIGSSDANLYGSLGCFKIGDARDSGATGVAYVSDNDCLIGANCISGGDAKCGDGFKQTNGGLSPIVARRNCIQVQRYVLEAGDVFPGGTSFDEDTLWTSDATRFVKWGGTRYGSLVAWRSATGQETGGAQRQGCGSAPTPTPTPTPAPSITPITSSPTPYASPTPTFAAPTPTPQPTAPPAPTATPAPQCQQRTRWRLPGGVWHLSAWVPVDCALIGVP